MIYQLNQSDTDVFCLAPLISLLPCIQLNHGGSLSSAVLLLLKCVKLTLTCGVGVSVHLFCVPVTCMHLRVGITACLMLATTQVIRVDCNIVLTAG